MLKMKKKWPHSRTGKIKYTRVGPSKATGRNRKKEVIFSRLIIGLE